MHKTLKTSIVAIALAGGGAIGLGTLASASYGDEPPTTETPTDTESIAPQGLQAAPDDATDDTTDDTTDDATGDQVEGGRRGRHGARHTEAVAEALGITPEALQEARAAGQSIADVAAAQGVDISVVEQAILDDIQEHLAAEVTEGELTQAEADEKLANAGEKVTEMVNRVPGEGEGGRRGRGLRSADTIAETLGVTVDDLQAARQAGQSLADVATAQGVNVDTLVQAIVDDVEQHLADKVTEGELTQAEADEKLADAEEHVTERVTRTPGEGGPRGERPTPAEAGA